MTYRRHLAGESEYLVVSRYSGDLLALALLNECVCARRARHWQVVYRYSGDSLAFALLLRMHPTGRACIMLYAIRGERFCGFCGHKQVNKSGTYVKMSQNDIIIWSASQEYEKTLKSILKFSKPDQKLNY